MKLSTKQMLKKIRGNIGQEYLPIILPKTMNLLVKTLKKNKPVKILEVGTGIGYSACCMLATLPKCQMTCIDIDDMRISRAIYNFRKYGFFNRVTTITGDAKHALFSLDDKFDFIFLDALETEYIHYVPDIKRILKKDGILFSDNVGINYTYDGGEIHVQTREQKAVKEFLEEIQKEPFETKTYKFESGVAISKKIK